MAAEVRGAEWRGNHSARRHPARVLLAGGVVALVAGIAILAAGFAPMFGIGGDTALVAEQAGGPGTTHVAVSAGDALSAAIVGSSNRSDRPVVLDRPVNGVAFTIRIPALNYTAKVYEGVDERTLLRGPGHYPRSAWPGRDGTVGVAAHNVYWLQLNRLKAGDRVELQSAFGRFAYQIRSSKITSANDLGVLRPTDEHRLVLTTCYPLWAGAFATKRLVFFATEIGAAR